MDLGSSVMCPCLKLHPKSEHSQHLSWDLHFSLKDCLTFWSVAQTHMALGQLFMFSYLHLVKLECIIISVFHDFSFPGEDGDHVCYVWDEDDLLDALRESVLQIWAEMTSLNKVLVVPLTCNGLYLEVSYFLRIRNTSNLIYLFSYSEI